MAEKRIQDKATIHIKQNINECKCINDRVILQEIKSEIDEKSKIIITPDEYKHNVRVCKVINIKKNDDISIGDYVTIEKDHIGFRVIDNTGKEYINTTSGCITYNFGNEYK